MRMLGPSGIPTLRTCSRLFLVFGRKPVFTSTLRHWLPEWGVRLMVSWAKCSPPDRHHRGAVPVAKFFSSRLIEISHQCDLFQGAKIRSQTLWFHTDHSRMDGYFTNSSTWNSIGNLASRIYLRL
jgi:hypothetical protein